MVVGGSLCCVVSSYCGCCESNRVLMASDVSLVVNDDVVWRVDQRKDVC